MYIYIYTYVYIYREREIYVYTYIRIYIYIYTESDRQRKAEAINRYFLQQRRSYGRSAVIIITAYHRLFMNIIYYSGNHLFCRFPKFHRVFWAETLAHWNPTSCQKASTINLFGFETLKLKIRRLKLWKPTVDERRRTETIKQRCVTK